VTAKLLAFACNEKKGGGAIRTRTNLGSAREVILQKQKPDQRPQIFERNFQAVGLSDQMRSNVDEHFIPLDALLTQLQNSAKSNLTADAIVFAIFEQQMQEDEQILSLSTEFENVSKVVIEIRGLEPFHAMDDGRKWNSIPIVVFASNVLENFVNWKPLNVIVAEIEHPHPASDLALIQNAVSEYRNRLLAELDNLGLLVSYENGRYRVGPALTPHDRSVEGVLYYGNADQREGRRGKYYTVDRDEFGVQYEIEQFESLINNPDVGELDLQKFFVEHPHFLAAARLLQAVPLPHVRLSDATGKILIPDFVLKPIVAVQRDSNWEVLDLKRPQDKLLAGFSGHRGFSQQVVRAMNQVKDYKDYFEDPANSENVEAQLGHRLRHPRLAVLIGRMPVSEEVELLEKAQSRQLEVRIVTYDEILEAQRKFKIR
jgi:hypothetical protein